MSLFRAALAAAVLCLCAHAPGKAASFLSLNDAFRRVIDTDPDLAAYRLSEAVLDADRQRAAQTPPVTLETDVENVLGSDSASDFRAAELTLSLRSVIERGDKRGARGLVAERHREGVDLLREGRRLDLLAEVARRYLDALAADQLSRLTRDDLLQRETQFAAASQRRRAGAESEAVALAAEAQRGACATAPCGAVGHRQCRLHPGPNRSRAVAGTP
jgi:cobalt-zinc-cadmium efflux system outer membrane protein